MKRNVLFLHSIYSNEDFCEARRSFVNSNYDEYINHLTDLNSSCLTRFNVINLIEKEKIDLVVLDEETIGKDLPLQILNLQLKFPKLNFLVYFDPTKNKILPVISNYVHLKLEAIDADISIESDIKETCPFNFESRNIESILMSNAADIIRPYLLNLICICDSYDLDVIEIKFPRTIFELDQIKYLSEKVKKLIKYDSLLRHMYATKFILPNISEEEYVIEDLRDKCNKDSSVDGEKNMENTETISSLSKKYNEIAKKLSNIVVGQEHAINAIVKGLYLAQLNKPTEDDNRTLATFFLFGPSGCGKTYLAENLAKILGYEYLFIPIGEYATKEDQIGLIGSDPVFKEAKAGELTKFINKNSSSPHIILVDEIEKAHQNVLKIFLHAIGSGKIKDLYAKTNVSLNNTILIFTSNVGKDIYDLENTDLNSISLNTIMDAVRNEKDFEGNYKFSPEFCSRIMSNNPIIFNKLKPAALVKMAKNNIEDISKKIYQDYKIKIKYDKRLPLLFLYHYGSADGRLITNKAKSFIQKQIFALSKHEETIDLDKINKININTDFNDCEKDIKDLFIRNKKVRVGIVAQQKDLNKFNDKTNKYEIINIKNEDDLTSCLNKNIVAYFIDPMFGGVKQKSLSITDYNTDGIDLFYSISEKEDVPIYILNKQEYNLTDADKISLINDGARKVIDVDNTEEFNKYLQVILDDCYMEQQSNSLNQKGFIIDYKEKQIISKDNKTVDVTLYDFSKYAAYDYETSGIMLKKSDVPDIKFDDVIGCEMAKKELKYYINYLRNPLSYIENNEKQPKGILLYGPPGTGKTMLAKAMAGEAQVNFISVAAADLIGSDKIKKLFTKARKYAPTVIFIDEIDAIGKKRDGSPLDSVLTSLLIEMDGFKSVEKRPVFVLAATNYGVNGLNNAIAQLDPALIRRFDNQIYVELPNKNNRAIYIEQYLKKKKVKNIKNSTISTLANCTIGESLASLDNILELAHRNARRDEKQIDDVCLLSALGEYHSGQLREVDENSAYKIAIHEAGHAYVSYLYKECPSFITIESRGNYGGFVQYEETSDVILTKKQLLNKICEALSGRLAEEEFFGKAYSMNTGSISDLQTASSIALSINIKYGMNDNLVSLPLELALKTPLAADYIKQANALIHEQQEITSKLIHDNKDIIDKIAKKLVDKGHLTSEELINLIEEKNN